MFCIYCGKEIPDGSECDCRKQASADAPAFSPAPMSEPAQPSAPGVYNPSNSYSAPQYGPYANAYQPGQENRPRISAKHQSIKEVLRSPLMIITCILFSADIVLGLINGFSMDILLILSAVGLWLVYASSLKQDAPLKPVGFTFHSIVLIIQRVFLIILYAVLSIVIFALAFIPDQINDFIHEVNTFLSMNYNIDFMYDFSFTSIVFIILFVVCTCWFLFMLFYNITLRNNVRFLSDAVRNTETRRKFGVFPGVVFILHFISQAASAVTYIVTAGARNKFFDSFFNALLRELEKAADTELDFTLKFTTNYLSPIRMAVSAAAMLFAAIITFRLRARLNQSQDQ